MQIDSKVKKIKKIKPKNLIFHVINGQSDPVTDPQYEKLMRVVSANSKYHRGTYTGGTAANCKSRCPLFAASSSRLLALPPRGSPIPNPKKPAQPTDPLVLPNSAHPPLPFI